jgi:hypothetical protein
MGREIEGTGRKLECPIEDTTLEFACRDTDNKGPQLGGHYTQTSVPAIQNHTRLQLRS